VAYRSVQDLKAGLDHLRGSPTELGTVELIVCRPAVGEREILEVARLDLEVGLVGDSWHLRGSTSTPDGLQDPEGQITVMNARAAERVAGPIERWALAGDQLYVDLDLSSSSYRPDADSQLGALSSRSPRSLTGAAPNSEIGSDRKPSGSSTRESAWP